MTNTLRHENGHWSQEKQLDTLVAENSLSSEHRGTMDRNHHSSLNSSSLNNNVHETDSANVDEEDGSVIVESEVEEEDDEAEEENEVDEEEADRAHTSTVPYMYTGHLGTTSPSVLKHIDEAINEVVNHFRISKSDLNNHHPTSSNATASHASSSKSPNNKSSSSHHTNNSSKVIKSSTATSSKVKRKRKKARTNNYQSFAFDQDTPFELGSANKKKADPAKKKDNHLNGPVIRVERKKNQTNYVVVNSSSKLEDKDKQQFNKLNYGSIAKSKSSNQILFQPNDNTWICVFCKRQPHYKQLGDLFGPHEIVSDKCSDSNGLADSPSTSNHQNNTTKNEVWFHEDCIIWSNGIYLAGNRVRHLDEVVIECSDITCCGCK